ncbi:Endonuclease [Nymphaea thermarum]|nr:Endonuclease [Nymphaea thermarum]
MSILERFADQVLLTMATTHHGELKTLKYSNHRFENACVEFDEENLKPTYKILWGVPVVFIEAFQLLDGRSNAINIAERLGLAPSIIDDARIIYGSASAEINEVIIDLERYKQEFQQHVGEARKNLRLAIELHEMLLEARQKINKHRAIQRFKKMQEIYEVARGARSTLHKKLRDFRASKNEVSKVRTGVWTGAFKTEPDESQRGPLPGKPNGSPAKAREFNEGSKLILPGKQDGSAAKAKKPNEDSKLMLPGTQNRVPEIGAMVYVPSLARKMKVLKVDASKAEVVVQASNMKLKLRLSDITF